MNIEHWPLERIIPYARNPRDNRAAVSAVKASIKEFGFRQPIVVDKDGVIVAGHTRYLAAQQLELDSVPVHVATELTPIQIKAYRLADNRTADNATWDDDLLKLELQELQEQDFDLDLTGFDDADLARLIDQSLDTSEVDAEPQIDKAEELREKWGVTSGQLWQLGEHRLICGDCTDPAVVARVMDGEKAGCCVTDPPYGINRDGIANDNPEGLQALFDGCLSAMPVDDGVLIAFQSPRLEWVWLDATRAAGWKPERMLWMYKPNDETFPWRGWLLTSEAIRVSSKGKAEWIDIHPYTHDCYSPTTIGKELSDTEGWHASVKPLTIIIDLMQRVGGIVYDPFLGSGTTMIAAQRLGRRCFGIEIEPNYTAVTLQRFFDATGIEPKLLSG